MSFTRVYRGCRGCIWLSYAGLFVLFGFLGVAGLLASPWNTHRRQLILAPKNIITTTMLNMEYQWHGLHTQVDQGTRGKRGGLSDEEREHGMPQPVMNTRSGGTLHACAARPLLLLRVFSQPA